MIMHVAESPGVRKGLLQAISHRDAGVII
jgi:hypothetical protein